MTARTARHVGFASAHELAERARDEAVLDDAKAGRFQRGQALLVLVLGDSMAYAPGVDEHEIWTTLLAERLRQRLGQPVRLLNAARPGANTATYLAQARELLPALAPDIVLLMYNYNDVYGSHAPAAGEQPARGAAGPQPPAAVRNEPPSRLSPLARSVRALSSSSDALAVAMPRVNLQLKAWGIILPGSEFAHLTQQAYRPDHPGWLAARSELRQLAHTCRVHGVPLAAFVVPPLNTVAADYFALPRTETRRFFATLGVPVGYGYEALRRAPERELALSPFDGHPNPAANRLIAGMVEAFLFGQLVPQSKQAR